MQESIYVYAIVVAALTAVVFVLLRSRRFYPPSPFAEAVERMKVAMVEMTPAFAAVGVAAQRMAASMVALSEAWAKTPQAK